MKYQKCSRCRRMMRIEANEKSCIYCGAELKGNEEGTERIWRYYWKGIVGQPFKWNISKNGTQSSLFGNFEGKR